MRKGVREASWAKELDLTRWCPARSVSQSANVAN